MPEMLSEMEGSRASRAGGLSAKKRPGIAVDVDRCGG